LIQEIGFMRTAIVCLCLALVTLAAQAAPAPLPKRTGATEEQERAYVQTEFDRMKGEFADRGIRLYHVRRGQWRREWVVRYMPDSSQSREEELIGWTSHRVYLHSVQVEVRDYKQFGQALRDALARLKK
jgi:hypothetical protein